MTYQIITYGCQMNKSDSERVAGVLEKLGFALCHESAKPDLVIVNICSVRQSAVDRAISKAQSLKSKLLITGCVLRKDKKRFRKISDGIFSINDLIKLPEILKKLGFKIKNRGLPKIKHYLETEPKYQSDIVAYVPIMTGCDNFCSYCVVPHTRGRELSRPADEIVCEVKNLIKKGVKEIWLLGQNVNSYKPNFAKLIKKINDIEGDFWIRFTSSHPKDLSQEMIEAMAKCQKITPYLNLPIQSGDDAILKAMNRHYSVRNYAELAKKTRQAFRKYRTGLETELALSTDAIVGFPGETKKQFENTKKTFKEVGFAFGYISRYSPRPGTAAAKLKDNISSAEKKKREKELVKIIEKSALEFNKKFLNKKAEVLILEKKNGFYLGKTRHYQTIKIPFAPMSRTYKHRTYESGTRKSDNRTYESRTRKSDNGLEKDVLGKFVKVELKKATAYGFEAKT